MKLFIKANANIDIQNDQGFTALHQAIWNGHVEVMQVLIKANADVNIKDKYGSTPLDLAQERKHEDMINYLSNR